MHARKGPIGIASLISGRSVLLFTYPGAGVFRRAAKEDYVLSQTLEAAHEGAATSGAMTGATGRAASKALLERILSSLYEDKAEDVIPIDLHGKSEMADHMVVASGRSSRQVTAIAEKLMERLKHELGVLCKIEGKEQGDWVLIDAGDVIVHVFRPEVRAFYQLEKMWMDPVPAQTKA